MTSRAPPRLRAQLSSCHTAIRGDIVTNFSDRTIWTGDNLDILRGLNSASVDLIYLDPPFNSNRNYAAPVGSAAAGAAFKDTWTLSDLDVAWMGLIADEQPAMYQVLQTAGLTHGKGMQSYLCMMAVRLLEMRRVLKDTGSIYLHCDPTASHYLKLLMDSIYGIRNFRNEIIWKRSLMPKAHAGQGAKHFARVNDVILLLYVENRPERVPFTVRSAGSQQYVEQLLQILRSGWAEVQTGQYCWGREVPPKGTHSTKSWVLPGTGGIPKKGCKN